MRVASGAFGAVLQQVTQNVSTDLSVEQPMNMDIRQLIQSVLQVTTSEQLEEISDDHSVMENIDQQDIILSLAHLGAEFPQVDGGDLSFEWLMAMEQLGLGQPLFDEVQASLEGRGALSEQQVTAIVVELKKFVLQLSESDRTWEQQQVIHTLQDRFNGLEKQLDTIVRMNEGGRMSIHPYKLELNLAQEESSLQKNGLAEEVKSTPMYTVSSSNSGQTIDRVETVQRQENFMRDLQMIFKRSNFGQTGGTQRLLIKLYPEQLGQIRIELLQSNGMLTARILTSTALGKELLDSQLTQLRNAFVQQNLQVERIDISQSIQQPYKSDRDQSFHEQFGREQQETTDERHENDEDEQSFKEYLLELEV